MIHTNVIKKRGILQQFCQNYGTWLAIAITMFALIFGVVGVVLNGIQQKSTRSLA